MAVCINPPDPYLVITVFVTDRERLALPMSSEAIYRLLHSRGFVWNTDAEFVGTVSMEYDKAHECTIYRQLVPRPRRSLLTAG
jgi:hypothetical protein